jgi:nucleoside-diphosphate-sugar epimerase
MRRLVTGADGFIGSRLTEALTSFNHIANNIVGVRARKWD